MENALMIGLARQMTLRRAMDITANNVANMSTAGFKLEHPVFAADSQKTRSSGAGRAEPVAFVEDWGVSRDFRVGRLERTDRPFDLALKTDGFFVVETEAGEQRFTRDGRFTVDADGRLTTASGLAVLDENDNEIRLDANGGAPSISSDGSINVDGASLGRIAVVDVADKSILMKDGAGLFRIAPEDGAPAPAEDFELAQGFVEASNVEPISEITRMIETARAYESVSRLIQQTEDLKRRAVEKLGRA